MNEYKRLFYMHRPDLLNTDIGSVTNRLQFKEVCGLVVVLFACIAHYNSIFQDLQCKPFSWFLQHIYPEKFILDDPK